MGIRGGTSFAAANKRLFGFAPDAALVIESVMVEAEADPPGARGWSIAMSEEATPPQAIASVKVFDRGQWRKTPLYRLDQFGAGAEAAGPALALAPIRT